MWQQQSTPFTTFTTAASSSYLTAPPASSSLPHPSSSPISASRASSSVTLSLPHCLNPASLDFGFPLSSGPQTAPVGPLLGPQPGPPSQGLHLCPVPAPQNPFNGPGCDADAAAADAVSATVAAASLLTPSSVPGLVHHQGAYSLHRAECCCGRQSPQPAIDQRQRQQQQQRQQPQLRLRQQLQHQQYQAQRHQTTSPTQQPPVPYQPRHPQLQYQHGQRRQQFNHCPDGLDGLQHPQPPPACCLRGHPPPRLSYQTLYPVRSHSAVAMAEKHDMAAQQAAAKDYQPTREGPFVGDKMSSEAITNEYAKADPIYVEKTIALPQKYSHYRPIQGDGNCGWRAIGFSFYEKILECGDQAKIEGQVARLVSLTPMITNVGGYAYFEDFAEEAIDILRILALKIDKPEAAMSDLCEKWNDETIASGLIYYFRLLAATYLKANAATYDPFVPDGQGIEHYCSTSIEPVDREIEQLGIVALVNMLLKPVDFVLEIAYLDRSPGSSVNTYRFPEEANTQDQNDLGPTIHLLYRPDHYDILYPAVQPPAMVAAGSISMQVNRATGFSHNMDIASTHSDLRAYATIDYGVLAMIPGMNPPITSDMSHMTSLPTTTNSVNNGFITTQPRAFSQFDEMLPVTSAQYHIRAPSAVAPIVPTTPSIPLSPTSPLGQPDAVAMGGSPVTGSVPDGSHGSACNIRFGPAQLDYDGTKTEFPEPTFDVTTNIFKNSVWNKAHYGNPKFHPEEWIPKGGNRGSGSRKRDRGGP